jgi:hypothetical protein
MSNWMFNACSALMSFQKTFKITNEMRLLFKQNYKAFDFTSKRARTAVTVLYSYVNCPNPHGTASPKTAACGWSAMLSVTFEPPYNKCFQFNSDLLTSMFLTITLVFCWKYRSECWAASKRRSHHSASRNSLHLLHRATQIFRIHSIAFVAIRLECYKAELKLQDILSMIVPRSITTFVSYSEEPSALVLRPMVG